MSGRTIAVTGGAGFIGTHLCRALSERGFRVRCVDRLSASYAPGSGREAWAALGAIESVTLVRADVCRDPLDALLGDAEAVIHLAALPGVRADHAPSELWNQNVLGTARLVREAAREGRRFVLASTSSVYGSSQRLPTPEHADLAPLSPYAFSKLAAEHACLSHGADAVIARLFTVFGPGQRPDMAFARWIRAIVAGRPVDWCARPETTRDFTYVGDAVAGLIATLENGTAGQTYNLAGAGPTPLRHALDVLGRLLGRRPVVRRTSAFTGEATVTWACGRKAARELGYRPSLSLEQGLERQIAEALGLRDPLAA